MIVNTGADSPYTAYNSALISFSVKPSKCKARFTLAIQTRLGGDSAAIQADSRW